MMLKQMHSALRRCSSVKEDCQNEYDSVIISLKNVHSYILRVSHDFTEIKKKGGDTTVILKLYNNFPNCQALYHEPLAREIVQALPVLLTLNLDLFYFFILKYKH